MCFSVNASLVLLLLLLGVEGEGEVKGSWYLILRLDSKPLTYSVG